MPRARADRRVGHTTPNAGTPFTNLRLSSETAGSINLAGYRLAVLAYNSCP